MNITDIINSWYESGELHPLSYQYTYLLKEMEPEIGEGILLLGILAVESVQNGHTCLKLDPKTLRNSFSYPYLEKFTDNKISEWVSEIMDSDLVSTDGKTPFVFEDNRLYLQKYWVYENFIAEILSEKAKVINELTEKEIEVLDELFRSEDNLNNEQKVSIALALIKNLLFITGGPGTGKTYTVIKILNAILRSSPEDPRIAVCAPTGKAAQKLMDSIKAGLGDLGQSNLNIPNEAITVHKLLGADRFGSEFRYNESRKLPYEVIIIDEASMLDAGLWFNLLRAITLDTKVIFLGDKDQLASVEAGSLLGDICRGSEGFSDTISALLSRWTDVKNNIGQRSFPINDSVVFLKNTYRFSENSGIKMLSESIRKGDTKNLFKILNNNNLNDVRWVSDLRLIHDEVVNEFGVNLHKDVINTKDFFEISKQKKILCAIRNGFYGVAQLNDTIEKRIKIIEGVSENREWYDGRIILSTKNDNMTGIRNGEQGICSLIDGQSYVVFENQQDHSVPVQKLNSYEAAYATTIHKSQGSEFENVAVILPSKDNFGHVSRELLYTSVTRARKSVLLVGNQDMITHAVNNPITRNSGLAFKLR